MKYLLFLMILIPAGLISCKNDGTTQTESADSLSVNTDSLQADSLAEYAFTLNDAGDKIYSEAEEPAEFPGGSAALAKFISGEIVYPKKSMESGSGGTVMVSFIVDEQGSVNDVEVISSLEDDLLNAEAARVVRNMPDWSPGKVGGEEIKMQYILPVAFTFKSE